jgi:hypothetical protein
MSRSKWVWGAVLAIAILAIGAILVWALPGDAEARRGAGWGNADCSDEARTAGTEGIGGYRGGRGSMGSGMQSGGMGMQGAGLGMQGNADLDGTCDACGEDGVSGSLTEAEVSALTAALEDEHKAKALYEQAIASLGSVQPLTRIVRAEERHIAALERVFTRYGLEVPEVEVGPESLTFATLADACAAGVTAEEANVALYDGLFTQVEKADVTRVLTALQRASQNSHLPALEACAP